MDIIGKFTLSVTDSQVVGPGLGGLIPLCVQVQRGEPRLWARIGNSGESHWVTVYIYGTGHPLPEDPGTYLDTFQLHDGGLVFHVFWRAN